MQKRKPVPHKLFVVKKSAIHKRGVFATTSIPKGTHIVEYKGEKITKAESYRRATEREAKGRKYRSGMVYIFEINTRYDLDGNIANNPAKYINHSCEPNCEAVLERGRIWIVAKRAIEAGEELSFNYGYDLSDCLSHPCHCKAPSCLGFIVRTELRSKLKKLINKR